MNKLQHLQYLNFNKPSRYADNITAIPAKPSLDLNFARNKSLMDNVTGNNLVTFTRASTGTYTDSAGVLRTATTNLVLGSADFSATYTALGNVTVTSDATAAPDGSLTADSVAGTSSTLNIKNWYKNLATNSIGTYTASVYLKANTQSIVLIRINDNTGNNGARQLINLSTGALLSGVATDGTATGASSTISNAGNGWYRCTVTCTFNSAITSLQGPSVFHDGYTTSTSTNNYFAWGAQLEQSSTVGEYVSTTSAINSAPRFDHRITSSVTNLLLRSEEFNNAPWASQSTPPTITANTAVSPNETLTADTITFASTDSRLQSDTISFTAGVAYTFSIYAKAVGTSLNRFRLAFFDGAQQNSADFTVSNLTWTRITATFIAANTAAGRAQIRNATDVLANSLFFWGAQLEQSATVGPYVPTTTAAATSNTTESLGLLVEEPRINLLLRSEEFDNASWAKVNVTTTANTTTAPNGTITADSVTPNTVTTLVYTQQNVTTTASTIYTWSVYVKANGFSWVFLDAFDGSNHRTWFDIANGAVGTVEAGNTSTIAAVGNGWYRCTLTRSSAGGSTSYAVAIVSGNNSQSVTGNSSNGIYAWGAQLEAGSTVSSYILNVNTPLGVTRNADVAQITGTNFSSWYRQDEGTVYVEGITQPVLSRFPADWSVHDGTDVNKIEAYNYTNVYGCTVRKSGEPNTDPTLSLSPVSGAPYKKAIAIKASDYRVSAQGQQGASANPAFVPTVTEMRIGANRTGGSAANATIKRLTYWKTRLPNANLQRITQ